MTESDIVEWFGADAAEPIMLGAWRLEPTLDWCWGDDEEERPCLEYELFTPDGKYKATVARVADAQRIIDKATGTEGE